MNNIFANQQTVNATDIRFNLGRILEDLDRQGNPVLIISRSKPKAWLYPYESINTSGKGKSGLPINKSIVGKLDSLLDFPIFIICPNEGVINSGILCQLIVAVL